MTVMFKPLAGILKTRKYLPLQFMPLTIELSLVDNPVDPIIYGGAVASPAEANTFYDNGSSNKMVNS